MDYEPSCARPARGALLTFNEQYRRINARNHRRHHTVMELIHHRSRKFKPVTPDRPDILTDIQKPDADTDLVRAADQIAFHRVLPTLGAQESFIPLRNLRLWMRSTGISRSDSSKRVSSWLPVICTCIVRSP